MHGRTCLATMPSLLQFQPKVSANSCVALMRLLGVAVMMCGSCGGGGVLVETRADRARGWLSGPLS